MAQGLSPSAVKTLSGRLGCPLGTNVCRAGGSSSSFCDLEAFHPSRLRVLLDVASFLVRSGNSVSASTVASTLVAVHDPMFFGINLAVGPRQGVFSRLPSSSSALPEFLPSVRLGSAASRTSLFREPCFGWPLLRACGCPY